MVHLLCSFCSSSSHYERQDPKRGFFLGMRLSNRAKFRGEIWVFGNQPTDRRQPLLDEMSAAFPTTVTPMMETNCATLVGTGVALGIVHVLTGPDHLSALATLSAVSDPVSSFFLGVRWGIGHSTGLLAVGIVLILKDISNSDEDVINMPDSLSHFLESLVGVFMIFLGFYGFRRACQKNQQFRSIPTEEDVEDPSIQVLEKYLQSPLGEGYQDDPHPPLEATADLSNVEDPPTSMEICCSDPPQPCSSHRHSHTHFPILSGVGRTFSARTMAVAAGIIHGLAGPGGVLGVIPAVQLHDWKAACIYLGFFCAASTLTMGCFACLYGACSSQLYRKTNLDFHIHFVSSSFSILVGITWLVLLSMGKLEDVFP